MDFVAFCRSLGIIIDHEPPIGRWVRLPTERHPRKKNGAVKFLGDHGFAQEHSTMTEVAVWRPGNGGAVIDRAAAVAAMARERERIERGRLEAASRAGWILTQCRQLEHPYLARKGFLEARGLVWETRGQALLVVPMRVGGGVVGCQLIDEHGKKRFLTGQRTAGATNTIGQGPAVYCEGYATGLSAAAALKAARMRYKVVVCFSAHNLRAMARDGHVLADNDASRVGEVTARATGRPYWMSPEQGEDFNDFHCRAGLFQASQAVKALVMRRMATAA